MASQVYVKVVGFRDVERHAINTVFRLSLDRAAKYALWTPDTPSAPNLILLDADSYEGGLELASSTFNPHLKLICVGEHPPEKAWRSFNRPLNWSAIVHAMDQLFTGSEGTDFDFDTGESSASIPPPGVRASLLVDTSKDQRMYLRARLALAGFIEVKEALNSGQAIELARQRHYDAVIVNLDQPEIDGWALVDRLMALEPAIGSIILSSRNTTWLLQERAELAGCRGVLEIPFDPLQIKALLSKI